MTATFQLDIYPATRAVWPMFREHHYLSHSYHAHRSFIAVTPDGEAVALTSIMALPHAHLKNAWREHRTVVLPDFQGLGVGTRLSDWLGEYVRNVMGGRYYSRTTHPRMGAYREASPHWRATGTSGKRRTSGLEMGRLKAWKVDGTRVAFSHEYLGREFTWSAS